MCHFKRAGVTRKRHLAEFKEFQTELNLGDTVTVELFNDCLLYTSAYEAIVKGEPMPQPGIPESLNVLLHELRGLGLSINLE